MVGGAAGFGAAITHHFVAAGGKAVVIDISQTAGEALASSSSGNVVFLCRDVSQETTWDEAGKLAVSTFGYLTTVINNAGITADPRVRALSVEHGRVSVY
jgi:3alpha(or 20beta)-hydroxysteroid dehydrogenase